MSSFLPFFLRSTSTPPVIPAVSKQWTTAFDGLDKLTLTEADVVRPKDGEVLVKILAVSLNARDAEVVKGEYGRHAASTSDAEPLVPCSDMCGVVVESKSNRFKPGARVMAVLNQSHMTGPVTEADLATGLGFPLPGVLAEYRCFPGESLVAAPGYLTDEEAACLPTAAVTAWMCINGTRPLGEAATKTTSGGTVLLQGTGGVAMAGLQIAKAGGLAAIITSTSDSQLDRARGELGADHGINSQTHWEWQQPVLDKTGGKGADIIFEAGGARTLRKSFECVAFGGLINCVGDPTGKKEDEEAPAARQINVNVLALRRSVTLKGVLNGPRDRFEEMASFYEGHAIRPVVDRVFKMSEAGEAFALLAGGEEERFGKVVIRVVAAAAAE